MENIEQLLEKWHRGSGVMHISHLITASRHQRFHRLLSTFSSSLSAVVATSIFVAALEDSSQMALYYTASGLSLLAAGLSATNSILNFSESAEAHQRAGSLFQGIRREIEVELVNLREGDDSKKYEHLRNRWTEALNLSPPLPQKIHNKVKKDFDELHTE